MLQQIQSRYAGHNAVEIRYANANGDFLDTSSAIATGAYERCQIFLRYSNGMRVWVNGHSTETWVLPSGLLPPNGWHAQDEDGYFVEYSALKDGYRVNYVASEKYVFADGRGTFTHFGILAADGAVIAHRNEDGTVELIPIEWRQWPGLYLDGQGATAIAMDKDGESMVLCEVRSGRGLVYVVPKPDAFSYRLSPTGPVNGRLTYNVREVTPGQLVVVQGDIEDKFQVPSEAKAGNRIWKHFENKWIHFTVLPIAHVDLNLSSENTLELTITSGLASGTEFMVKLEDLINQPA